MNARKRRAAMMMMTGGKAALPSIVSDTFNRADGALGATDGAVTGQEGGAGLSWRGTTWAISTNKAVNTPVPGANLVTNGEFTTNTAGWSVQAAATLTRRDYATSPNIAPTGGVDNYGMEVANTGTNDARGVVSLNGNKDKWVKVSARVYAPSANVGSQTGRMYHWATGAVVDLSSTTEDAWETLMGTGLIDNATSGLNLYTKGANAGDLTHYDAVKVEVLAITELLAIIDKALWSDVIVGAALTRPNSVIKIGVACNIDDPANPANGLVALLDGSNARLYEVVAGVWTAKASGAITYGAGWVLAIEKSGDTALMKYNGVQIGVSFTVNAAVQNNQYVGMFKTNEGASIDNFYARRYL